CVHSPTSLPLSFFSRMLPPPPTPPPFPYTTLFRSQWDDSHDDVFHDAALHHVVHASDDDVLHHDEHDVHDSDDDVLHHHDHDNHDVHDDADGLERHVRLARDHDRHGLGAAHRRQGGEHRHRPPHLQLDERWHGDVAPGVLPGQHRHHRCQPGGQHPDEHHCIARKRPDVAGAEPDGRRAC